MAEMISSLMNCLPFRLINCRIRNHSRMKKDPNFTCVDSALEILEQNPDFESGFSISGGLEYIRSFLLFVRNRKCLAPYYDGDMYVRHTVRCIKGAFETAGADIGYAIKKGEAQRLIALRSTLQKKIALYKARIRADYGFFSTRDWEELGWVGNQYYYYDEFFKIISQKYRLHYEEEWKSLLEGLEWVRIYGQFIWYRGHVDKKLVDLANTMNREFRTAGKEIEKAFRKGDIEHLDRLRADWVSKMDTFIPAITVAFRYLSDVPVATSIPTTRFPLDYSLETFARFLVYNAEMSCYYGDDDLRIDLIHFLNALQWLGVVYLKAPYNSSKFHGYLIEHVTICLARVMFLWWVDRMDQKDVTIMISKQLQRIKPTTQRMLQRFMEDLSILELFSKKEVSHFVGLLFPPRKTSLKIQRDGLEYLLLEPKNVRLLRNDIHNIISDAVSLDYSYLISAEDNDELLFQLLQKIIVANVELVLTELVSGSSSISIETIIAGLTLMQAFLISPSQNEYFVRLAFIFERIEQVVRRAQLQAKRVNDGGHDEALKLLLFLEFKLLKIQAFLTEQMRCCSSLAGFFGGELDTLEDALKLHYKYFSLLPSANQGDIKLIRTYIKRLDEETPPYYVFSANHHELPPERFINEMSDYLSRFLQKVNRTNSEIQGNVLHLQRSLDLTFPMIIEELVLVDVFLEKLRGLEQNMVDYTGSLLKHQIEGVLKELDSLRSFLFMVGEKMNGDQGIKALKGCIIRALYEAEYLIDWILLVKCDLNHLVWLSDVIDDMKVLNSKVGEFVLNTDKMTNGSIGGSAQLMIAQATTSPDVGEAVISLEDQENVIIDRLTDGVPDRRVVTISGMAGIGKTTLAKKVYDNPLIRNYFKRVAWCCVSQVYRRRELLYKLLSDITDSSTDEMDMKTDDQLLNMLYQSSKKIRYLVVMDDVWETQAWDELKSVFPDDQNGSRILFTTRDENLGFESEYGCAPHTLRFLNVTESWKLLQQKVFRKEACPEELRDVGLEIAKGCKGLPLSIIAIAGVLKTTEKKVDWWKEIEKDLNSRILQSPDVHCMGILELSYSHLPNHLKPCFLYFAAFGEDTEVPIQKLLQFWIAEGFVAHGCQSSPEDVAERYVENLIARSLLMLVKIGSNGRVKACKVHDMLYKLCMKKVEEDSFLQYVNGYDKLFPSSKKKFDYGYVGSEHPPISVAYEQHRLSICSKRKHFVMVVPSGYPVRTLLFSATSDRFPGYGYPEIAFTIDNFKILSILDIECINVGSSFPKNIEFLYPLRYLALSGDLKFVPSTISKLWNLRTLIVKGLAGDVAVSLPDTLWNMLKLRHLHVSTRATFSLQEGGIESSSKLENMVSLSCPSLSHGDDSVEKMKLFPNLQKLRCTFSEPLQHSIEGITFPALDFLKELESLKIIYYGRRDCQLKGISFPLKLKKLSLSEFSFTWDEFSVIGKLLSLKILKLESIVFESSFWEMNDDEFQQLEYLKLESMDISEWYAEKCHLPHLQKLVVRSCSMLEEVPEGFGYISTLQMIELVRCSTSAVESVMNIQKKQIEYSNDGFKVIIDGLDAVPPTSTDD